MVSQSNAINSPCASYAIYEGSVNSIKLDYQKVKKAGKQDIQPQFL